MKPYIVILIISLGLMIVTCEENNANQEYLLEAKVLGRNTDCGVFAIQFTKNIQRANEIAGTLYTESTFIARNLPTEFQVEGLLIVLDILKIKDTETGICTAMAFLFMPIRR